MAPRRRQSTLAGIAAVTLVCWTACGKDKSDHKAPPAGSGSAPVAATGSDARCEQLGRACGDTDKHIEKVVAGCKQAALSQADGCTDKINAAYDCFERELCGKGDNIWALDDFGVLVERHKKCVTEHAAAKSCGGK